MQLEKAVSVVLSAANSGSCLSEELRDSMRVVVQSAKGKSQNELRLIELVRYFDKAYGGRGLAYDAMNDEDKILLEEIRGKRSLSIVPKEVVPFQLTSQRLPTLLTAPEVFNYILTCSATPHVVPGCKGLIIKKTISHITLQFRVHNKGRRNILKLHASQTLTLEHIQDALRIYFYAEEQLQNNVPWHELNWSVETKGPTVKISTAYELMQYFLKNNKWNNPKDKASLSLLIARYFQCEMAHIPLSAMTQEVFRLSFLECHSASRNPTDTMKVRGFFNEAYLFAIKRIEVSKLNFENFCSNVKASAFTKIGGKPRSLLRGMDSRDCEAI